MPKFVIERNIPNAGELTMEELAAIAKVTCGVLQSMGTQIQWIQSFVTDDKIYCIYIAPDEATVREHARLGEFPADAVQTIHSIIDPTTAESARA